MRTEGVKLAATYLSLVLVLMILLLGSHLVPDGRIADQLVSAREAGEFSDTNWVLTRPANLEDKYADCFGASQGLGYDGLIDSALRSPNLGACPSANAKLDTYVATGELTSGWDYFRYWHGYTVVTRPAIAAFGLAWTRYLLTAVIVALTAAVALLATRRTRNLAAAVVVVPLVASTDLFWMASSIPTAVGVIAALAGPALVLTGPELPAESNLAVDSAMMRRVLIAGGIVPFADLLSVGPISWALTVAGVALMLTQQDVTNGRSVRLIAAATAVWIASYFATWMAKWALSATVVGVSRMWRDVRDRVEFRLDGQHDLVEPGLFRTSEKTFRYWLEQPLGPAVLIATACVVAGSLYMNRARLTAWWTRFAIIAAPAALVVIWYEVVSNHSQIHHWLTYRYWAVAMGIIAAAALLASQSSTVTLEAAPAEAPSSTKDNLLADVPRCIHDDLCAP